MVALRCDSRANVRDKFSLEAFERYLRAHSSCIMGRSLDVCVMVDSRVRRIEGWPHNFEVGCAAETSCRRAACRGAGESRQLHQGLSAVVAAAQLNTCDADENTPVTNGVSCPVRD